jgi:hypothetical protein
MPQDSRKKITLAVTADQLNDLGNSLAITVSLGQRNWTRVSELLQILFCHTSAQELYELGEYLVETANKEDPITSHIKGD